MVREAFPRALLFLAPLVVLLLCLALGQTTFYPREGTQWDGLQLIYNFLERGNLLHPNHPLYLPFAFLWWKATAFTGLGTHRLLTIFSALCTALAVLLVGLWGRRASFGPGRVLALQFLAGLSPAVVFFGTVVELHAFFLPFALIPFLLAEPLCRGEGGPGGSGGIPRGMLLGFATWVAALAHSTGNLELPLLGAWIAARAGFRRRLPPLVAMALVHFVLLFLGTPLLLSLLGGDASVATGKSWEWLLDKLHFDRVPFRVWTALRDEVLISHLPLWLACLLPWAVRFNLFPSIGRRRLVWGALGLTPYAFLIVFGLPDPLSGEPIYEHGSYLMPLVFPAAWLLSGIGPREGRRPAPTLILLLCLAGLLRAVQQVRDHDVRPYAEMGAGIRAVGGDGEALFLTGQLDDLSAVLLEAPRARAFHLTDFLANPSFPVEGFAGLLEARIRELAARKVPTFLTARAFEVLTDPAKAASRIRLSTGDRKRGELLELLLATLEARGRIFLESLRRSFELVEVSSGPFRAFLLRAR